MCSCKWFQKRSITAFFRFRFLFSLSLPHFQSLVGQVNTIFVDIYNSMLALYCLLDDNDNDNNDDDIDSESE